MDFSSPTPIHHGHPSLDSINPKEPDFHGGDEKEDQQEEPKESGERDTALLKGAVGSVAMDGSHWSGC